MRFGSLHTVLIVLTEGKIQGDYMIGKQHHEQQNQSRFDEHIKLRDACP